MKSIKYFFFIALIGMISLMTVSCSIDNGQTSTLSKSSIGDVTKHITDAVTTEFNGTYSNKSGVVFCNHDDFHNMMGEGYACYTDEDGDKHYCHFTWTTLYGGGHNVTVSYLSMNDAMDGWGCN